MLALRAGAERADRDAVSRDGLPGKVFISLQCSSAPAPFQVPCSAHPAFLFILLLSLLTTGLRTSVASSISASRSVPQNINEGSGSPSAAGSVSLTPAVADSMGHHRRLFLAHLLGCPPAVLMAPGTGLVPAPKRLWAAVWGHGWFTNDMDTTREDPALSSGTAIPQRFLLFRIPKSQAVNRRLLDGSRQTALSDSHPFPGSIPGLPTEGSSLLQGGHQPSPGSGSFKKRCGKCHKKKITP